jgi:hypothetical protein
VGGSDRIRGEAFQTIRSKLCDDRDRVAVVVSEQGLAFQRL